MAIRYIYLGNDISLLHIHLLSTTQMERMGHIGDCIRGQCHPDHYSEKQECLIGQMQGRMVCPLLSFPKFIADIPETVNSCGLTSAIQSIARLIPELLAANLFVEENASATPSSVLVGVANWDVLPLVKLGVPIEKSSINATNMMSSEIWCVHTFSRGDGRETS